MYCHCHAECCVHRTLLYELSTGKFPMSGSTPDCIIYQVCRGRRSCLKHISVKHVVKVNTDTQLATH